MRLTIPTTAFLASVAIASLSLVGCTSSTTDIAETVEESETAEPVEESDQAGDAEGSDTVESVEESDQAGDAEGSDTVESVEESDQAGDAEGSDTVESVEESAQASAADPATCGAEFRVTFDEGAPRDRIVIENDSSELVELASVSIDLVPSAGRIIFDTTEEGEGVEVFQDFQVEGGDAILVAAPIAVDGGTSLELEFSSFGPGQSFTFSIDVDDRLADSDLGQIQVTGAEIQGAVVDFTTTDGSPLAAVFGEDNTATATPTDRDQTCAP